MNSIGFPISHKENERRRAILPNDVLTIEHPEFVFIENGYGDVLGIPDSEYTALGCNVTSRADILSKDIICDPKVGDAEYLDILHNQTIFGWVHAIQNKTIVDKILHNSLTVYAWEDMYYKGRHCFYRNNEIAGEAAVIHAYMCNGIFPVGTNVAVLGRGNTARGAVKTLNYMGANVVQYSHDSEALFKEEIGQYDVIVNSILWDVKRKDHIITQADLKRMKKNAMIIDISCDRNGAIETSIPTTLEKPTYIIDGITHYVVDHTPTLYWKTTSETISSVVGKYVNLLINGYGDENEVLRNSKIIDKGVICDKRINEFQCR